jgi:hypothetical protein
MSAQIKAIKMPRISDLLHAVRIEVLSAWEAKGSTGCGPLGHGRSKVNNSG